MVRICNGSPACSEARRQEPECRDLREPVKAFLTVTEGGRAKRICGERFFHPTALRLLPASLTTSRAGCSSLIMSVVIEHRALCLLSVDIGLEKPPLRGKIPAENGEHAQQKENETDSGKLDHRQVIDDTCDKQDDDEVPE